MSSRAEIEGVSLKDAEEGKARARLEADLGRVDELLLGSLEGKEDVIPEMGRHLISSGGKRLRPMVTLASAHLCGYEGDKHIDLAAAVELMHTATLLHDDVVDEGFMRRGKVAARRIWGNSASILVGDFLLGRAFELMVRAGSMKALEILSRAASRIAEGEVMQLSALGQVGLEEESCMRILEAKTATLFAAAAQTGAILGEKPEEIRGALESYGLHLGLAFQLADDALDYGGGTERLGKKVGNDFEEGKMTLPVILSYGRGDKSERDFWERVLSGGRESGDFEKALALMEKHKALEETRLRARGFAKKASDALSVFPKNSWSALLKEVAVFTTERLH